MRGKRYTTTTALCTVYPNAPKQPCPASQVDTVQSFPTNSLRFQVRKSNSTVKAEASNSTVKAEASNSTVKAEASNSTVKAEASTPSNSTVKAEVVPQATAQSRQR